MKRRPNASDLVIAQRCAEVIRKLHPDVEVILYGSRARGKPEQDSDMDLLVLTKQKLHWQDQNTILSAVYPIELETGMVIVPIVEYRDLWYTPMYQVLPLAKAVVKEGIQL